MKKQQTGVWLYNEFLQLIPKISLPQAFILSAVKSLTESGQPCHATNAYFAKLLRVKPNTVSGYICDLVSRNYLAIKLQPEYGNHRELRLGYTANSVEGLPQMEDRVYAKRGRGSTANGVEGSTPNGIDIISKEDKIVHKISQYHDDEEILLEKVILFFKKTLNRTEAEARSYYDTYHPAWKHNGTPIKSWQAFARKYKAPEQRSNEPLTPENFF